MSLNIFDYTDYRTFIRDYYELHKAKNPSFSFGVFAKKAGFSSRSFLPMVISGKKSLAVDSIRRLVKAMGLLKREATYFESLVLFNQTKNSTSKEYYDEILKSLKQKRPGRVIDKKQFAYLSNWYYPVIREMVMLPDFKEDKSWIRERLGKRVNVRQVRDAVEDMLNLGLLKRDEAGHLRQVDTVIATECNVPHSAIFMFHYQMIMLAREVLAATKGAGTEITGLTIPLSKKQFKEVVTILRDCQNDIVRHIGSHTDIPDSVAQLNIQFFKVTE